MKKHIPDTQDDLSHLTREELEQWYRNMAYVAGLLTFQFGTNLTVNVPAEKLLEYGALGYCRMWFSVEQDGTRVFELRRVE